MPFVTRQSDALSHSSVLIVNGDRDICSTFTNKLKAKGYEVGSMLDESVLKTVILELGNGLEFLNDHAQ